MGKREKREQRRAEREAEAAARKQRVFDEFRAEILAQVCPACGQKSASWYLYGLPDFNDELDVLLAAELIVLAGSGFCDEDPRWVCRNCKHRWGRLFPEKIPPGPSKN